MNGAIWHGQRAVQRRLGPDPSGLASIEYALLASLLAVTIVASVLATGNSLAASMNKVEQAETLTVRH